MESYMILWLQNLRPSNIWLLEKGVKSSQRVRGLSLRQIWRGIWLYLKLEEFELTVAWAGGLARTHRTYSYKSRVANQYNHHHESSSMRCWSLSCLNTAPRLQYMPADLANWQIFEIHGKLCIEKQVLSTQSSVYMTALCRLPNQCWCCQSVPSSVRQCWSCRTLSWPSKELLYAILEHAHGKDTSSTTTACIGGTPQAWRLKPRSCGSW